MVPSGSATTLPSFALHSRHPGWALEAPAGLSGACTFSSFLISSFAGAKSLKPEEAQFGTLWPQWCYCDLEIRSPSPPGLQLLLFWLKPWPWFQVVYTFPGPWALD